MKITIARFVKNREKQMAILDLLVIAGLFGLNVFQFVYWSRVTSRLVDKIMSKNYAEYVHLSKPKLPEAPAVTLPNAEAVEEQDVLNVLNGMFGA